ncbi:hypothetical protein BC828DRAFT_441699 [Blastocladiella britannica]|nr:hypothetical protein BC828DRAFT_441699 [Blastocladiella britannica]
MIMIDHVSYRVLELAAGASDSPEDALDILGVLPQNDLVLTAVLSRGFGEFRPALAVKHGLAHLLPRYPSHVLFNNLSETLAAAAELGSLSTLVHLWETAGPTTVGRAVWFEPRFGGFLDAAVRHGHIHILDWLVDDIRVPLKWDYVSFLCAASNGHLEMIQWGLARGHLDTLNLDLATGSTATGDMSLLKHYFSLQPHMPEATLERILSNLSGVGYLHTLVWWWETEANHCKLPEPAAFAKITHSAIANGMLDVVQWWWDRFLEFRTPEHKFGSLTDDTSHLLSVSRVEVAEWLWQRSHTSGTLWDSKLDAFSFAPDWKGFKLDTGLLRYFLPSALYLEWLINKCVVLGTKLELKPDFMSDVVRHGHVETLDVILHLADKILFEWDGQLVSDALDTGRFNVLQWWEANRNALPPQCMDLTASAYFVASHDNVEMVEWCYAHMQHSPAAWQAMCQSAIQHNSRKIQIWLRSHVGLFCEKGKSTLDFKLIWPINPFEPAPYTLDFVSAIASNIGTQKLARMQLDVAMPVCAAPDVQEVDQDL